MKRFVVPIFLFACHSNESTAIDAAVVKGTAEEIVAPPDAPPPATLVELDGGAPARERVTGGVLLCKGHQTWTPPDGFTVTKLGDGAVARKDNRLVALAYPAHEGDSYAKAAATFVNGMVAWDSPAMNKIDEWHAESTAHGHASNLAIATLTLYAGVDAATGKGRTNGTSDAIWIAIAPTDKEAGDLLADARKKTLMLVDHACECGYDCLPKRK